MMDKLRRFMIGRYGSDRLGWGLLIGYFIWSMLFGYTKLRPVGLIFILLFWYRFLSKDVYRRYNENQKFIAITDPFVSKIKKLYSRISDRDHRYFTCPNCKQTLRVPRGVGKITITCPSCRNKITKKA